MKKEYEKPELTITILPDAIATSENLTPTERGVYDGEEFDVWQ